MKPTNLRDRLASSWLLIGCVAIGLFLAFLFLGHTRERKAGAKGTEPDTVQPSLSSTKADGPSVSEANRLAALTATMERARDIGLGLNAPMEFHGRIIDQYAKPVSGVRARFNYIYYNSVVRATYEPHKEEEEQISDMNGDFAFSGKEGITLTVTLERAKGLRFGNNGYWSHSFQSDKQSGVTVQPTSKEKPLIFRAYRLGQPAVLKQGSVQEFLIPDKRTYQINLREGKISEEGAGDLKVTVWQSGTYGKSGTSWGISLESSPNLQFQPTEAPLLYWAPRDGYQSTWSFAWTDGEMGYGDARDFKFWIKQGDLYGSLSMECGAFFKERFRLIVRSSLNEKPGDQNLQPVLSDWPLKDAATAK